MKKVFSVLVFFALFFIQTQSLFSQNISGVINSYAQVTAITNNTTLVVSTTLGINVGDKVIIMQMQGATVTQTNTVNFGDITAYNNAGNYEYCTIASINTTTKTVVLQSPLCKSYTVADVVQLIRIPVYANPTVTGTLTCQAWNGTTGGVLAFIATGTVNMQADMNVSANGFRGGTVCFNFFGCNSPNFASPLAGCTAGKKGESIAKYILNQENGRGHLANGGGAGENGNNGGGGGSNFSTGGLGGNEYSGCGSTGINGRPGEALNYSTERVFMGGGGGAGFADNSQTVTPGGNGGGIIIIKAATINGNNFFIRSNGASVTGVANDESAGGGGAGGSIYLNVGNYSSALNTELKGGDGGSTHNFIFTNDCHGPGGGGSGGILWVTQPSLPANINFTAPGGTFGLVLNPVSSCYNTGWGALAGGNGGIKYNLDTAASVNLGNDTVLCSGDSITLNAGGGYTSYLWNTSDTSQTITVYQSGNYSVQVGIAGGCSASDQINIVAHQNSSSNQNGSICSGQAYTLPDGSQASVPGTYIDTVPSASGCDSIITTVVSQGAASSLNLNPVICTGNSYTLTDGTVVTNSGTYIDTVPNWKGCDSIITTTLLVNPLPTAVAYANVTIQQGQSTTLTATGGGTYTWTPTTGLNPTTGSSVTASPDDTTVYCVIVTDSIGCTDSACVTIKVIEFPCPTPENMDIPNAFSPNEDGVNDEFCLQGWDLCIEKFNITIYDRWGEKTFESNDPNFCWDGKYKGKIMDAQVFVYYVRAIYVDTAEAILKTGNISLIR